jgi:cyclohexanone monooxygenase
VDAPSISYSLSLDPDLDQEWHWPEEYSAQADLERYANYVADRFRLRPDIVFDTTVTRADYLEEKKRWLIRTDDGDMVECKYFVSAAGCLSATNVPDIKGLETFGGNWYHTSRWPKEGVDLTGEVVGIIGTGSTGIQAVPVLAQQAQRLLVFQRTPNYSLPSKNKPMDLEYEKKWKQDYPQHRHDARWSRGGNNLPTFENRSALSVSAEERNRVWEELWTNEVYAVAMLSSFNDIATNPAANETLAEFVRTKIRGIVKDPEVAELLCPKDYPIGAKRICVDSGYFQTFNRPNVTLVDVRANPIIEITPTGLQTTAASYPLDVLVFATGFDALTGPLLAMNITGKGGLTLRDKWKAGPKTYLGVQSAGFPNLFMITGPGSPSVLSTMTTSIEQHVEWIGDAIAGMEQDHLDTMEPEPQAEEDWVVHVNEIADKTLMTRANSWYLGANIPGKPRVFMPYLGGVGNYRGKCQEIADKGYPGFVRT